MVREMVCGTTNVDWLARSRADSQGQWAKLFDGGYLVEAFYFSMPSYVALHMPFLTW